MITLKNGTLFINGKLEKKDLVFENNKIIKIEKDINMGDIIDCTNLLITPSFIDPHVHLREPGFEYKETIKTGTEAAARGGYTRIFLMPNLNPVPDDIKKMIAYQNIIKNDSIIKCDIIAPITKNQKGENLVDFKLLDSYVIGYSDDGKGIELTSTMYEAMRGTKKPILSHSEDETIVYNGIVNEGIYSKKNGLKGILDISETVQLARDLVLAKKTNTHYHLCHISCSESLELIKYYKKTSNITVEVTPHHLLLNENDLIDNGNYKMNPPLRTKKDQEALIEGIRDGSIDCIATDHAPHSEEEKNKGLKDSNFGIIGLETSFPMLYTKLVLTKKIELAKLLNLMSKNVSTIFKIKDHSIKINNNANLTIIDLNNEYKIDKESFLSKGRNTPFHGKSVFGKIKYTIYNGKIVYKDV